MAIVCGVDEAGRGPLIGPLVMCGVTIDEKDEDELRQLGVKDSKLLAPNVRERMYDQIIQMVKGYKIIVVEPKEIDDALESPSLNLNKLEAVKGAEAVNELPCDKVIIDCPSNNVPAYSQYFRSLLLNQDVELICEHKADFTYPVVSAASILAKVTRDRAIKKIKEEVGMDIGSGYPADEVTRRFLEENYDKFPHIFRKTWSTYQKIIAKHSQKSLGDF